jgi:4-carboxymuconolactone decarboxylase
MASQPPRIPPVAPETMTETQRAVAARIAGGPRGGVRGPFLALLQDPELADRVQQLGEFIRYGTGLPKPLTELAILVAARRWSCQYEWFAHAPIAREAGVAEATIAAIAAGTKPAGLDADAAAVYEFCTNLHKSGDAGEGPVAHIAARFGMKGVVDLVALTGYYSLLAMVLNTAGIPLPGEAPPPLPVIAE